MSYPADLRYTDQHEWVRDEGQGVVTVGITDHAQEQLGDIVHAELPEVGDHVAAGKACCEVESVKAVSDVYSPVSGEIVEVNGGLEDNPDLVNREPHSGGWLFRVRMSSPAELGELLDARRYVELLDNLDE